MRLKNVRFCGKSYKMEKKVREKIIPTTLKMFSKIRNNETYFPKLVSEY